MATPDKTVSDTEPPFEKPLQYQIPNGPLLIVAAVRQELGDLPLQSNGEISFLLTGMGKQRAGHSVRRWLQSHPCRGLVITGFSGGVQPDLRRGELIVADEVVDAESGKRYQPGLTLSKTSSPFRVGRLVTLRKLALTRGLKLELGSRYQALGVDLETAAVAEVACEAQLPWAAVRVVLDPLEEFLFSPRVIVAGIPLARKQLVGFLKEIVLSKPVFGVFSKPV